MHTRIVRIVLHEIRAVLLLGLAMVPAALAVHYAAIPQCRRAGKAVEEYRAYQAALDQASAQERVLAELAAKREALEEKLHMMTRGFGNPQDLSALLQVLINRANVANINFVKIQPQAGKPRRDYVSYPVLLEFSSGYHAAAGFIASLEELPQLARVERLALTAKGPSAVDVKLLVTMYLQQTENAE